MLVSMTDNLAVIFRELGLNEKEILIYLSLSKMEMATASMVARSCNLQRSSCYTLIEKLVEKGVLSIIIKNNVQFFLAVEPLVLLEEIQRKQQLLVKQIENLKINLRGKKFNNSLNTWTKARYFCGERGVADILNDVLKERPEILRALLSKDLNDRLAEIYPCFSKERIARKIAARAIYPMLETEKFQDFPDKLVGRDSRLLPRQFDLGVDIFIYGEKVAVISINEGFALLIESRVISKAMEMFFDAAWILARKLKSNPAKFKSFEVACHPQCK
jgi:sugar-specific transcriptional regulator TrmB